MNVEEHIDAEVALALEAFPTADASQIDLAMIPAYRKMLLDSRPPIELPPTTTEFHDERVDDNVTVRVLHPPGPKTTRPCIYWIHGGGYMFGSALMPEPRLNRWVEELDCVIVSVDYRLAPEHPFPAPMDDCYAGLLWTYEHAGELGIDAGRVVIGGQSAGGGLCAGLAQMVRDKGEVRPVFQLLIYPMIDDRNESPSTHIPDAPIWTRELNALGWRAYLGREPGGPDTHPYAAANRAQDLTGLPPAFICVGTLDVFRDENIDYAMRLLEAGVATELHVYPGGPHGFEVIAPSADISRRCNRDVDEALRRVLQPS